MKTRQKFLYIVCVLIIGLVCFFFAGGFAWDLAKDLFGRPFDFVECVLGLFIFVSLLSALATCICRLIRIHFNPSKAEKSVAVVYLCLAILGYLSPDYSFPFCYHDIQFGRQSVANDKKPGICFEYGFEHYMVSCALREIDFKRK